MASRVRDELKRFEEFGLGRGVDITDASPFANKKSFQVQPIDAEDMIICTDEGGALHSIIQKLDTSDTYEIQLSASATLPKTPIQIGAAVEYSRSTTRSGYTIGKKVITRNVEFKTGHHLNEEMVVREPTYFEKWITPHSSTVKELVELITKHGITHYISKIQLGAAEYCTMSEDYYISFVKGKEDVALDKIAALALSASNQHTRTSLVSETKRIGVMNDKDIVESDNEAVVDVQLESIVKLIKNEHLKDALTKALCIYVTIRRYNHLGYQEPDLNIIGNWLGTNSAVSSDVIAEIRQLEYTPKEHEETHQYAICCNHGEDMLFLDIINGSNQVVAWKLDNKKPDLNYFHLRFTEIPGEFIIMDYNHLGATTRTLHDSPKLCYNFWPLCRYLKVETHLGYNSGPLRMENSVDEYHCRLKLRPRLFDKHSHVNMSDFTNGKDMFYICTSRRHGITSFLYIKDRGEGSVTRLPDVASIENESHENRNNSHASESNAAAVVGNGHVTNGNTRGSEGQPVEDTDHMGVNPRYILACKPTIDGGNSDELMLFRLVRYENMYVKTDHDATSGQSN